MKVMTWKEGFKACILPVLCSAVAGCTLESGGSINEYLEDTLVEEESTEEVSVPEPAGDYYMTSRGGEFGITRIQAFSLSSSQVVKGFAVFEGKYYLLLRTDLGSGVIRWYVHSRLPEETSWTAECSFLNSSSYEGGLAVDSDRFYVFSSGSTLYRFKRGTCQSDGALSIPDRYSYSWISASSDGYPFIQKSDDLYWYSYRGLFAYEAVAGSIESSYSGEIELGDQSFSFSYSDGYAVEGDHRWSLQSGSFYDPDGYDYYYPPLLWKLTSLGEAVAWGVLPVDEYPVLDSSSVLEVHAFAENELIVLSVSSDDRTLRLYTLDVSAF